MRDYECTLCGTKKRCFILMEIDVIKIMIVGGIIIAIAFVLSLFIHYILP